MRGIKRRRSRKRTFTRLLTAVLAGVLVLVAIAAWLFVVREGADAQQKQFAALPATTNATTTNSRGGNQLVRLPADDAPHNNITEWWYYSGHLKTDAGQRFAYHVAIFLRREFVDHTIFHVSLVDLQSGKHYTGQARTAGIPGSPRKNGFDFRYAGWNIAGSGPRHKINIKTDDFTLALNLADTRPPVLHQAPGSGGPGLLDFGVAGKSYYYSRTRVPSTGTLTVGGAAAKPVTGQSWFDHQWGDFVSTDIGWNWFAIQLDDGAEVMLYQVFDQQRKVLLKAGTYNSRDGKTVALGKDDYVLEPLASWTSPDSGSTYPVSWKISIPGQKLALTAKAFVNASEFNGLETILLFYWEGPIHITGSNPGVGFLEMSGYGTKGAHKPSAGASKRKP